jgi:hypothetical protein
MEAAEDDDALGAHARLRQAEMQGVVAAAGQVGIDGDQVLHLADLGRQHDLVAAHAKVFCAFRRQERGLDNRFTHNGVCRDGGSALCVLVHQLCQKLLIERAPVDADPHRFVVLLRDIDDLGKLRVALGLEADIARVDPVFVERCGAVWIVGEELVADIVKVAHQRHVHANPVQPFLDMRDLGGCFCTIDSDPNDFRACPCERRHLRDRRIRVCGIRVGHGLNHDRRAAADHH